MHHTAISVADKAAILGEALPYIRRFSGSLFVIKYGGNAMTEAHLKEAFAKDVSLLKHVGIHPVIVHGGGPQINAMLEKVGKKSTFLHGMRITDDETMRIVEMVLGAQVNKEIVALINRHGGKAIGLTGRDGNCIRAEKMRLKSPDGQLHDIGRAGRVQQIDTELLGALVRDGYIPVIAPIGADDDGNALNINADLVAGSLATALAAEKLIMMTNISGVLDKNGNLLTNLTPAKIDALIADGTLSGGMLPKIGSALEAAASGVKAVHIIDGRELNALLLEIFTDTGIGSMIRSA